MPIRQLLPGAYLRFVIMLICLTGLGFSALGQHPIIRVNTNTAPCVGGTVTYSLMGGAKNHIWSVSSPSSYYTIIGGTTGESFTVKWNVAQTATVSARYTDINPPYYTEIAVFTETASSVTPAVSISSSAGSSICSGSSVTFTAKPAYGGSSPRYQWQINGVNVSGATSKTFTTSSLSNGQRVSCILTSNAACSSSNTATSNTITMSVQQQKSMTVSISGPSEICHVSEATFVASVSGASGALTYKWKRNGVYLASSEYSGSKIKLDSLSNGEFILCEVYTKASCYDSPAISNSLTLKVNAQQSFTAGMGVSGGLNYCKGDEVTFRASPSHTASSIQWQMNGHNVKGATGSAFKTTATSVEQLKSVKVTVTSSGGCFYSNTSTESAANKAFVVKPIPAAPTVSTVPTIKHNSSLRLTAGGAGADESYNWYNSSGDWLSSGSTYTTPRLNTTTTYYVSKFSSAGKVCESNKVPLKVPVNQVPIVNAGSDHLNVLPQEKVELSGTASDPDGKLLAYVWTRVSGPATFTITGGNTLKPIISNLVLGTYEFQFTVNDGIESKSDNVIVEVVPPPNNYNYIRETTLLEPLKDHQDIAGLAVGQKNESTTYFDGLGRPMQQVSWQASPSRKDMVQPIQYDPFGREARKYLPYATAENKGEYYPEAVKDIDNYTSSEQYAFYQTAEKVARDAYPYAQSLFEASPLHRIQEQGAPGNNWQPAGGHSVKFAYRANTAEERVINWLYKYAEEGYGQLLVDGYYPAGELYVTETEDEDGNLVKEYKDKQGRVVLKDVRDEEDQPHYTYYVYDDLGNLRAVLQPAFIEVWKTAGGKVQDPIDFEGYQVIENARTIYDISEGTKYYVRRDEGLTLGMGFASGTDFHVVLEDELEPVAMEDELEPAERVVLSDYVFYYHYDERQRLVEKHVPGGGITYMVYDQRDRLVLSRDEEQKEENQWVFTKYDQLNRPILSGLWKDPEKRSREELQEDVNMATEFFEERKQDAFHGYTTHQSFPHEVEDREVLTVSFYDDYSFSFLAEDTNGDYAYEQPAGRVHGDLVFEENASKRVKGQLTGSKTKMLGANEWLYTVHYYDEKYRLIQLVSENQQGGIDRQSNAYDFTGKVMYSLQEHKGREALDIFKEFKYDHAGRLRESWQSINGGKRILLSSSEYNALGELIDKRLHSEEEGEFMQSVDYRYNIRGWLTHINNSSLSADEHNDDSNDFFGMELAYVHDFGLGASKLNYNGNITAVKWSANLGLDGDENQRGYTYNYDGLNRIKTADYHQHGTQWSAEEAYALEGMEYDQNGNIQSLMRKGEGGNVMDRLVYHYGAGGNRLLSVSDKSAVAEGFKDGNTSGDDYSYYRNGNLKEDKNKGISEIRYNHLNLPREVIFNDGNKITYSYDAAGIKLSQLVEKAGEEPKLTEYIGGMVYENGALQFIRHEEGRVVYNSGEEDSFEYQYHLKDHLGNVRMSFTSQEKIDEMVATLETAREAEEYSQFLNYQEVTKINAALFDHTKAGGATHFSQRLSGTSREQVGLAKSLAVMPGDRVSAEVYAKYVDPDRSNWNGALLDLMSSIAGAGAGVVIDGVGVSGDDLPFMGLLSKGSQGGVKAYLNMVIVDKNFNFIDGGFVGVGPEAKENGSNVAHQHLSSQDFTITQPGYVYVWLSNENEEPVDVFFDDFTVTHKHSPVIQADDYYPFGLTHAGSSYTAGDRNKYLYNGKELQDDLGLGWYDYGWRDYDPALGRWLQVDPNAVMYPGLSPYNYVYNNPINAVDPDGADGILIIFPDYEIQTPAGRIGGLGHAGVVIIDPKTGYTKYYEYGRYDAEGKGVVRNRTVPNVVIGENGRPTSESLQRLLKHISEIAGHGGRIEGTYVESDKVQEMMDYAKQRMNQNNNPNRASYDLFNNNCGTFGCDVLKQDPAVEDKAPWILDPRPNSIIEEWQNSFDNKVRYDPSAPEPKPAPKPKPEPKPKPKPDPVVTTRAY